MIDRLREQIQQRLDQLTHEADRLRKALAALDPRSSAAPARKARAQHDRGLGGQAEGAATKSAPARRTSQPAARSPRRTAPGATKASVLAALAGGEAMTAGQVADKTGLARPTVSTTLSKLSKTGEVQKAERGYKLAAHDHLPNDGVGSPRRPVQERGHRCGGVMLPLCGSGSRPLRMVAGAAWSAAAAFWARSSARRRSRLG